MGCSYIRYLICYDIADNKKRKKFSDFLKDLGLVSVQESVFYGDLKSPEVGLLEQTVFSSLDPKEDKCLWFPCHLTVEKIQGCMGLSDFNYDLPDGNKLL